MAAIELASQTWASVQTRAARQQEVLDDLASSIEDKRKALVRAMQNRKLLEKLKERQRLQAVMKERRLETKESDEVAQAQYHRAADTAGLLGTAKDATPAGRFRRE